MKKNLHRKMTGAGFLLIGIVVSACEHSVSTETIVHPDGSLDKTIIIEVKDSAKFAQYMLSEDQLDKWEKTEIDSAPYISAKEGNKLLVLKKKFASAEEANKEMASPNDSLFRITSKFEKQFRWFYTYIDYSDTYHMLNNMKLASADFFTQEDYAFIDRLPAEGKRISPADSLYLSLLNDKIYDHYGARAYFDEHYDILLELVKQTPDASMWTDSLKSIKNTMFNKIMDKDAPDNFILMLADSLHIPLGNPEESIVYKTRTRQLEKKINFITWASEGKYTHAIDMPWAVVETNADSVAGNKLYWHPSPIKFTLKEYTMRARARVMNYWAVGVSLAVVLFTGFIFLRKRSLSTQ